MVTPDFLEDGLVDVAATTKVVRTREQMTLPGLPQIGPQTVVPMRIGGPWDVVAKNPVSWGSNLSYLTDNCGPEKCMQYQSKAKNGIFKRKLDPLQCLDTYATSFGSNRSDAIFVSTTDLLEPHRSLPANNSLLYIGSAVSYQTPGTYWQCGPTNTFDCRDLKAWNKNPSIIQNWNIMGYKIDYCLVSENTVEESCGLKFSTSFLIGMWAWYESNLNR